MDEDIVPVPSSPEPLAAGAPQAPTATVVESAAMGTQEVTVAGMTHHLPDDWHKQLGPSEAAPDSLERELEAMESSPAGSPPARSGIRSPPGPPPSLQEAPPSPPAIQPAFGDVLRGLAVDTKFNAFGDVRVVEDSQM